MKTCFSLLLVALGVVSVAEPVSAQARGSSRRVSAAQPGPNSGPTAVPGQGPRGARTRTDIGFSLAASSFDENAGVVSVELELGEATGRVSVPFTLSGSAPGDRFELLTPVPLQLPAGVTTAQIQLALIDDNVPQPDQTIVLTLGTPRGALLGALSEHTLTVTDADGLRSDDFNAQNLDLGKWTFIDPLSDACIELVDTGTADARVELSVAEAQEHGAWTTLTAPRLIQYIDRDDFAVDAKFVSVLSEQFQEQGFLLEDGSGDFLRFDYYHDGTDLHVFAGTSLGGVQTVRFDLAVAPPSNEVYLRLENFGDVWRQRYSFDGFNWLNGGSFSLAFDAQTIGLFASNSGTVAPALTVGVDWFYVEPDDPARDDSVTAPDETGPYAYQLDTQVAEDSIVVSWKTDEPAFRSVDFGLTPEFELGTVSVPGATLDGEVTVAELNGGSTYFLRIVSTDAVGNVSSFGGLQERTLTGPQADDFNRFNLDRELWHFEDPSADACLFMSGTNSADAWLNITLPAGVEHDAWTTFTAPRVLQDITDGDFSVEVKFDSVLDSEFHGQGLIVEEDTSNFIRFDYYHDGTNLHVFTGGLAGGAPFSEADVVLAPTGSPSYLRVTRSGDSWLQEYSLDGANWTTGASFVRALNVGAVGLFPWNLAGSGAAPAVTMSVDYFQLTSSPIVGEDAATVTDDASPFVFNELASATSTTASVLWKTDELATTQVDYGLTTNYEIGSVVVPGTTVAHAADLTGLQPATIYQLRICSEDAAGNVTLRDLQVQTEAPAPVVASFLSAGETLSEAAGATTIDVQLNEPASVAVAVDVALAGSATLASDYTLTPTTLTFGVGQDTATLDLTLIDDGANEGPEEIELTLTNPSAGLTIGAPALYIVTISDNDGPPQISNVAVLAGGTSALVTWDTDQAATSAVTYGTAPSTYELGTVTDPALVTSHSILLTGLQTSTDHYFFVTSENAGMASADSGEFSFTTLAFDNAGVVPDDFNRFNVDSTRWTFIDPLGDACVMLVGTNTSDAHIELSVPAGTEHATWTNLESARLVQQINDTDFVIETRMVSPMSSAFQEQGLIFLADDDNFVRCDVYHDGTNYRVFAATLSGGTPQSRVDFAITPTGSDVYLRVGRTGDDWLYEYSLDGVNWLEAVGFTHSIQLSSAGIFCGNAIGSASPAHTAAFDYFFDAIDPVVGEDTGTVTDVIEPLVYQIVAGTTLDELTVTCKTDEAATATLELGTSSGVYNLPPVSGAAGQLDHTLVASGLTPGTTYFCRVVAEDSALNSGASEEFIVQTDAPPTPSVEFLTSGQAVGEADGIISATVVLSSAIGSPVDVSYSFAGSATPMNDYVVVSANPLTIPAGSTSGVIQLNLQDDLDDEGDEDIVITLDSASGALLGTQVQHTVDVADDDGPPTVQFAAAGQNIDENGGSVAVSVTLSEALGSPVTVDYSVAGTAVLGVDFTDDGPHPLVIPAGQLSADLTLTPIDNGTADGARSIQLTLGTPSAGAELGAPSVFVASLVDDEAPTTVQSDDFNLFNLDTTKWEYLDPRGKVCISLVDTNTADAALRFSFPDDQSFDAYTSFNAPRIVQTVPDGDFAFEAKYTSQLFAAFQEFGVLIYEDDANFIRFDLYFDGTFNHVFCSAIANGVPNDQADIVIGAAPEMFFRIARTGDAWNCEYSTDGAAWLTAASFNHVMNVASVGAFASNSGNPPQAFDVDLDYFYNTSDSLATEDTGIAVDLIGPLVYTRKEQIADDAITVTWKTDEPSIGTLEYGTSAGNYNLGTVTELAPTQEHSLSVNGLTMGQTYHYRLINEDAALNTSTSPDYDFVAVDTSLGPEIDVWYGPLQKFGQVGKPQLKVDVLGTVTDPDGVFSVEWNLNGGGFSSLTLGPNLRRLENLGDFVIEIDPNNLVVGANFVNIQAEDEVGDTSLAVVQIDYVDGIVWPGNYVADWSSGVIDDYGHVVDGEWEIQSGNIRGIVPGYDRLVAIGDVTWDDYEVVSEVVMHSIVPIYAFPSNPGPSVGYLLRWEKHTPISGQPDQGFRPFGGIGVYQWYEDGTERLEIQGDSGLDAADNSGKTLDFEVPYYFKMRVTTTASDGGNYQFKVWRTVDPEPAAWDVEATGGPDDLAQGSLLLLLHHADASFGPVTITEL